MAEALMDAIEQANTGEIHFILSSGLNVNRPLLNGQTPLNLSIALGFESIATSLIDAGANVHQADSFRYDECRRRPIHYAAATGNLRMVQVLLDAGAALEEEDYGSSTPLHHAAANGHADLVKFLISRGSCINHTSKSGRSALWKASQSGQRHVVYILKDAGADINVQNRVGQSILFDSIRSSFNITRYLVRVGTDLTIRDVEGNSVLHAAAMYGKTQAVQLFLDHGADIYAVNEYCNMPLHNAAMHDRLATTACLLNNSIEYNMQNMNGQSALYLTMVHKHKRITELLYMAGAILSEKELTTYKSFESFKYEEKYKFFKWARGIFSNPLSLTCQCRLVVRAWLNDTPYKSVHLLPIPTMLKRYVLFCDIIEDSTLEQCLQINNDDNSYESESDEQIDIVCDMCEKILSSEAGATWFRCTLCEDYDLCKSCWCNQVHSEHRSQMKLFEYHGPQVEECCFSCGLPKEDILEQDNIMYTCGECEDILMCGSCVEEGLHRKHINRLEVYQISVRES